MAQPMTIVVIATVAVITYSLWVRRHAWRSRWDTGPSRILALQALATLLLTPWASAHFGPLLHQVSGLWNVAAMLGHVLVIVTQAIMIDHMLSRLTDDSHAAAEVLRRRVAVAVKLGVPATVAMFLIADAGRPDVPDLFNYHDPLFVVYWVVACTVFLYLFVLAARLLLVLRVDPRSTAAVDRYLVWVASGFVAVLILAVAIVTGKDEAALIRACGCFGAVAFAVASTRSWRAKVNWFVQDHGQHAA